MGSWVKFLPSQRLKERRSTASSRRAAHLAFHMRPGLIGRHLHAVERLEIVGDEDVMPALEIGSALGRLLDV